VDPDTGGPGSSAPDLEQLMIRYQNGNAAAAKELIDVLSVQLCLFFSSQMGNRAEAVDMVQDTWLRLHRVRHTYRPGEPVLPWVYAIARRVRVDNFRRRRRIANREIIVDSLPEAPAANPPTDLPPFADLIAPLPESQREVLTLLKVNGLSIEDVARATSSTVGSVKQKVHRAYDRLRKLLDRQGEPR
jgi:RNA polymerase sigma-70 factor (ECF subfamily)